MIALLRYDVLKSARDGSLAAFFLLPMLIPVFALLGGTFVHGFHYPLTMEVRWSPAQNAAMIGTVASVVCPVFALMPAFWALRAEIETRSVAALAMAARPVTIVTTVVGFATLISVAAWIGSIAWIGLLTTALPNGLPLLAAKVAAGALAAASIGVLAVSISPQPAMIVAALIACMPLLVGFEKSKGALGLLLPVVFAVICTAVAGIFVERRCAA